MKKIKTTEIIKVAGKKRTLNVRRDLPDIRDRIYEPSLLELQADIDNRNFASILDQGVEGSCTGHGLAAVINLLNAKLGHKFISSPRMLYEMAKKHDKWPGEDYEGSSCRGAIRGWRNMGVCSEKAWPYKDNVPDQLSVDRAKAARSNSLGAYYRLRPEISDYHAAINEVGAIYVSARVHEGWMNVKKSRTEIAEIELNGAPIGGHAFAIVGYTSSGFIVQNSWGKKWGSDGFALWRYLDWIENISDGWVFRLALPTPQIFGRRPQSAFSGDAEAHKTPPRRHEIAGHFVHFDNGKFDNHGRYWSNIEDIKLTAKNLAHTIKNEKGKYKHLLIFAHGGLNDPKASARRIAALKDGFRRNGIYPFHIMYDTGLVKEGTDAILRAFQLSEDRSKGFVDWISEKISDVTDKMIEDVVRKPVTAIWNEIKSDALWPFEGMNDGVQTLQIFAEELKDAKLDIHLAGHSTGAILLGHMLDACDTLEQTDLIKSCSLMAPACTIDFYKMCYGTRIGKGVNSKMRLPKLNIYNLNDEKELADNTAKVYRKSLLCLVSRALEPEAQERKDKMMPILGMEKYSKKLKGKGLNTYYSDGEKGYTRSISHGGFDNDPHTLNHILKTILHREPTKPFKPEEMEGY